MNLVFLILISIMASAQVFETGSFILTCKDTTHSAHLMPLSVYESKDSIDASKIYTKPVEKIFAEAPKTFSSLPKIVRSTEVLKHFIGYRVSFFEVDSIVQPPAGCRINLLARLMSIGVPVFVVNTEVWDLIPTDQQNYGLVEAAMYKFMKQDLAPLDYRRFPLYLTSGAFESLTADEKVLFMQKHGVSELEN